MSDAKDFSIDLSKLIEKYKDRVDTIVKKVTLDIFHDVIMMSPVGNPKIWKHPEIKRKGYTGGRFRSNWVASIGTYKTDVYERFDKGGDQTLSAATAVVNQSKAGGVVYFINNLPYAQRLEYGYSSQAPAGMVRTAIANYQSYINNAVSSIN